MWYRSPRNWFPPRPHHLLDRCLRVAGSRATLQTGQHLAALHQHCRRRGTNIHLHVSAKRTARHSDSLSRTLSSIRTLDSSLELRLREMTSRLLCKRNMNYSGSWRTRLSTDNKRATFFFFLFWTGAKAVEGGLCLIQYRFYHLQLPSHFLLSTHS